MKRLKSIFFVVLSFLIVATTTIPIYAFEKDIVIDNSKIRDETVLRNNRYYYITEEDYPKTYYKELSSSDPSLSNTIQIFLDIIISKAYWSAGVFATIMNIGNSIYHFNMDGELKVTTVEHNVYRVDRLTSEKIYIHDKSYQTILLELFRRTSSGLEYVRSYSHTIYY